MQEINKIGSVNWDENDIRESIPEFLELYNEKPIGENQGGMMSPHMFAIWFMLRKLNPGNIVESGIWKGQGTWLIKKTLPNAKVYSIDINLNIREYISDKVTYFQKDFSKIDWSIIEDKNDTVLFFDDHQNALDRVRLCEDIGFKKFIFEDNYAAKQGDCYSLKKAFQNAGFTPGKKINNLKDLLQLFFRRNKIKSIPPGKQDSEYLANVLDVYYEFPPVFKKDKTRWGDDWNEQDYPTPEPVYNDLEEEYLRIFEEEAIHYTWICYAALK